MSASAGLRHARRAVVLALCATAAMSLPRAAHPALGPRYGGEVRVLIADSPGSSEPAVPRTPAERLFAALVHETLVGIDDEGRPRPALAQSWASAADGREWTLHLGQATFHDGAPVTAGDGARALRRFLRGGSAAALHLARGLDGGESFRAGRSDTLPGLVVMDDARLVLRWRTAAALPLAALASPAAAVLSGRGAGAGPFVPTTPPSARGVSATAFGRHIRGRPMLDVVRLTVVASPERARPEGADVAAGLPALGSASGLLLLVFDPDTPPFGGRRARAVAAASIDRAELARHFLPGGHAADVLLAPVVLAPWPVSPAAPSPGAPSPLRGRVSLRVGSDVPPSASQRVVAHLAALGLDVRAVPVPARVAATATGPRLLVWYPEVPEAGLALEELSAMAGRSAEVSAALEQAERERNADRRRAWLRRAEEALRATGILVPLARMPLPLGARPGLHGLQAGASGALILEHAWIEP